MCVCGCQWVVGKIFTPDSSVFFQHPLHPLGIQSVRQSVPLPSAVVECFREHASAPTPLQLLGAAAAAAVVLLYVLTEDLPTMEIGEVIVSLQITR